MLILIRKVDRMTLGELFNKCEILIHTNDPKKETRVVDVEFTEAGDIILIPENELQPTTLN